MSELPYERPPESEVYGRSLSTVYRLGAFMVGKSRVEVVNSPEADQARAEFFTSVEEGFGTDAELGGGLEVRAFDTRPVLNGRVMSKDLKTAISDMTDAGLKCAVETADGDLRFMPQLTRSVWDHKNAVVVDKMARGETGYNTRIVISPFPEEAAAKSGDDYWRGIGYVPHLRRGFVQVYHANGEEVIAGSLSFDGSDKKWLREVFGRYGVKVPEGEVTDNWLKYAVTGTFTEEKAQQLALEIADQAADPVYKKATNTVEVTDKYKPLMNQAFDESYIHLCESLATGRQTPGATGLIHQLASNAHHFNDQYRKALYRMRASGDKFGDEDAAVLHDLLVYSTIELMRALHLEKTVPGPDNFESARMLAFQDPGFMNTAEFQRMLSDFGAIGATNKRTYSACGLEISLGENDMLNNPQGAFGGADSQERLPDDRHGSRYFSCPSCGMENERKVKNQLEPTCKHCFKDVSCGDENKPKKKVISKKAKNKLFALASAA